MIFNASSKVLSVYEAIIIPYIKNYVR
jgi:hypothetical protein